MSTESPKPHHEDLVHIAESLMNIAGTLGSLVHIAESKMNIAESLMNIAGTLGSLVHIAESLGHIAGGHPPENATAT